MKKKCRGCGRELPIEEYYKHSEMADGHLNYCKDCVRARVSKHREANIEQIRQYDRKRGRLEHRQKRRAEITRRRRHEVEGYEDAHNAVFRAVKSGLIVKAKRCECCGSGGRIEAHHNNYQNKLNVVWLCPVCHRQYHMGKGEAAENVRVKVNALLNLLTF
jgi:hypothetical protein